MLKNDVLKKGSELNTLIDMANNYLMDCEPDKNDILNILNMLSEKIGDYTEGVEKELDT